MFLNIVCVRIFFHANFWGIYCSDLVPKFWEKSVEMFINVHCAYTIILKKNITVG